MTSRLTYEQKIEAYRGMAVATIQVVQAIIEERSKTTLDGNFRSNAPIAIDTLNFLIGDIRSGKIKMERVEALTWVQGPKVDIDE